jgi:hypothetical protein
VGTPPLVTVSGAGNVVFYLDNESYLNSVGQPAVSVLDTSTLLLFVGQQSHVVGGSIAAAVGTTVEYWIMSSSARVGPQAAALGTFGGNNFSWDRHFPSQVWTDADSPVTALEQELVRIDASGGNPIVVDLPGIFEQNRGWEIIIKEVGNSALSSITLTPLGADTIDGAATFVLPAVALQSVTIVSDGVSNWNIVAAYP